MFWTIFIILIAGLLLRHFFIWKPLDTRVLYQRGMLLFGHRGSPAHEPENTMASFRKAVEDGCNAIELDVHRSRDGHLMVMHDATLDRTTSERGRITDRFLAELKKINAAVTWPGREEPIPSLEEVIEMVPDDVVLNIEIKNFSFFSHQRVELEVVRFIHHHDLRDRVIVSSFNPLNIWRVKMADPSIFTAMLWHKPSYFSFRHPIGIHLTHPDIFHPYVKHITRGVRFWSRNKQIPMHVWVVNDAAEMKRLAAEPLIEGIMSDDTETLVATLGEYTL